jgi:hypothetical protein
MDLREIGYEEEKWIKLNLFSYPVAGFLDFGC